MISRRGEVMEKTSVSEDVRCVTRILRMILIRKVSVSPVVSKFEGHTKMESHTFYRKRNKPILWLASRSPNTHKHTRKHPTISKLRWDQPKRMKQICLHFDNYLCCVFVPPCVELYCVVGWWNSSLFVSNKNKHYWKIRKN